ncbi:MAG: LysR substrate-binding domain-containing protein [Pseudomonadota bacterium]
MEDNPAEFAHLGARALAFDLAVLRTFVLGVDLGTFAMAARATYRSASAVSAQIRNLEHSLGVALTRKAGRGLALTPAGEILVAYARRMLELNDQALRDLEEASGQNGIGLGIIGDLTQAMLPIALRDLRSRRPGTDIEVRIGRHGELMRELEHGRIQLFLGWEDSGALTPSQLLSTHPLKWIGSKDAPGAAGDSHERLALVFLSGRCPLRTQGTRALTAAGRSWSVACTSSSLDGVWAAVREGLGITVGSQLGLPPDLVALDGLPELPSIGVAMHWGPGAAENLARELAVNLAAAPVAAAGRPMRPLSKAR